jgi:hypothetical protein
MIVRALAAKILALCIFVCCGATLASSAAAQGAAKSAASYPAKPIRLIVPFAKGGAADYLARVIEPRWSQLAGQTSDREPAGRVRQRGPRQPPRAPRTAGTLLLGNLDAMAINTKSQQ